MRVFISAGDYDRIKKGEEVEILVEAKNRPVMAIWAFIASTGSSSPSSKPTGYENAVFNGECDGC